MLERVFRDGRVLDRLRGGVLGSRLDDLAAYLDGRGHSSQMIEKYVRAVGHFAHWLGSKDIAPSALSEETLRAFTEEHRTRCSCSAPRGESLSHTRAAVAHWLGLLRRGGEIPPKEVAPKEPAVLVLDAFDAHLQGTCGASPGTRRCYLKHVRFFLRARYGDGPVDLTRIVPKDLVTYISDYAARVKRRTAKKAASALRTFLRSLQLQGLCGAGLVAAVPSIRSWKLSDIPRVLSEEQVQRLLTSFDRTSGQGRRDYAMALLMARLGLRAGEVAGMSLDDIDWRGGTLQIEGGKRRRSHVLPLPADVGRALVAYLKQGRPQSQSGERRLFLRHRPPVGEPISSAAVGAVIRRAHERGQVKAAGRGTHALRHTLATRLLRAGATLKEIADILGHRSIDTTAVYAKVDLARLARVGLPWPEVRS